MRPGWRPTRARRALLGLRGYLEARASVSLAPDQPGREILYPVATVVLGGLVSSTLLDFLVTPGLFWAFGRREAERLAAGAEDDLDRPRPLPPSPGGAPEVTPRTA